MANTRYNYDDLRTVKILQESTGPCRYYEYGPAQSTSYVADPQMRPSLLEIIDVFAVVCDIDSDLGITEE